MKTNNKTYTRAAVKVDLTSAAITFAFAIYFFFSFFNEHLMFIPGLHFSSFGCVFCIILASLFFISSALIFVRAMTVLNFMEKNKLTSARNSKVR